MNICGCGCGEEVGKATYTNKSKGIFEGEPLRFLNGHTGRTLKALARQAKMPSVNSSGLCECGCGQTAPLSKVTRYDRGQVKGQPVRFIRGHNSFRHTDDAKQRIAEAGTGRRHTSESIKKQSLCKIGPLNPMWKGGRRERRKIVWVYVGKEHPMAYASGYAIEHRLVAAAALGRILRSDEHVHHLDRNSLNNSPENLVVLNQSQHSRLHRLIDYQGLSPLQALRAVS